jgi:hypothetical protein
MIKAKDSKDIFTRPEDEILSDYINGIKSNAFIGECIDALLGDDDETLEIVGVRLRQLIENIGSLNEELIEADDDAEDEKIREQIKEYSIDMAAVCYAIYRNNDHLIVRYTN